MGDPFESFKESSEGFRKRAPETCRAEISMRGRSFLTAVARASSRDEYAVTVSYGGEIFYCMASRSV